MESILSQRGRVFTPSSLVSRKPRETPFQLSTMALAAKRSQIRKIVRAPSRHRTDVVDLVSVSQLSATVLTPPVGPSAYLLLFQGCQSLTLRGSRTGPGRSPNSLRRRRLGVCGVREPVPKAKHARSQIRSGTYDPSAHKHANENEQQKHKEREHFPLQECSLLRDARHFATPSSPHT